MILSYRDKRTERFARGATVKEFSGFARQAERRLDRLEAAAELQDLAAFAGNRLEALKGDRKGRCSIRINDQWRICCEWPKNAAGPMNVEIVDYHWRGAAMTRTPIHPGEHLAEEMQELNIAAAELARQLDVPLDQIAAMLKGERGITADVALRLGHWLGVSPDFWLNLQKLYELRLAENEIGAVVRKLPRLADRKTA